MEKTILKWNWCRSLEDVVFCETACKESSFIQFYGCHFGLCNIREVHFAGFLVLFDNAPTSFSLTLHDDHTHTNIICILYSLSEQWNYKCDCVPKQQPLFIYLPLGWTFQEIVFNEKVSKLSQAFIIAG